MDSRIAIITGASSGIGAATALRLAGKYEGLLLHARKSSAALEEIAKQVRSQGSETVTCLGELTDESFGSSLADTARTRWGRLDCVVANAGFPILKTFGDGTVSDLEYAFKGNVFSLFSLVKAASPLLMQSASGRVVAVGSFTSHVFRTDIRQFPMSAASKGAVETAVKSLAMYLADYGVTVNCVVPGFIQKPVGSEDSISHEELEANLARIPLKRAGQPNDVAAAIEFLLSGDASYVTGQSIHVNGGLI